MNDIMGIHFPHGDGFKMSFNVHGKGMGHNRGELLSLAYKWKDSLVLIYFNFNI